MSLDPILLVGGSGVVGRWTARHLRDVHREVPLLIGGRDLEKAKQAAAEIGNAEGVALDLEAEDLGLGGRRVSALAIFFMDETLAGLHFAQTRRVPYVSISSGLHEIGPDVAAYIHRPDAAPLVLAAEWLVGATTIPALEFCKEFRRIDSISIGALLDEQDVGGPAQADDLERLTKSMPAALVRRDGAYVWRTGEAAKARFRAADDTEMEASALSPFDVVGLAAATGAKNVEFNLATGLSSSRRRGEPISTEIIIELTGEDHADQPLHTRHAVIHSAGQMPPTGLGVAMLLERLVGLDGQDPPKAGLYFPYQLLDAASYLGRFSKSGGTIRPLGLHEEEIPPRT